MSGRAVHWGQSVLLAATLAVGCGGGGAGPAAGKGTTKMAPPEVVPAAGSPNEMAQLVETARLGRERADAALLLSAFTGSNILINVGAEPETPVIGGDDFAQAVRGAFKGGLQPAQRVARRSAVWQSKDGRFGAWAGDVVESGQASFSGGAAGETRKYQVPLGISAFARRDKASGKLEIVLWRVGAALEGDARSAWGRRVGAGLAETEGLEDDIQSGAALQPFAAVAQAVLVLQRGKTAAEVEAALASGGLVLAEDAGQGGHVAVDAGQRSGWAEARAKANAAGRKVEPIAMVGEQSEDGGAAWVMLDFLERSAPGAEARAVRVTAAGVLDGTTRKWQLVLMHEAIPAVMAEIAAAASSPGAGPSK